MNSKIIASINQTADGFCNHTDVVADKAHHDAANELLRRADLLILGRKTYELFYDFWPSAGKDETVPADMKETSALLNGIDKLIVSRSMKSADWGNVEIISELTKDNLRQRIGNEGKNVLLLGSPSIFSALTAMGMIDEYVIFQQPIFSGKGKRLFETVGLPATMALTRVNSDQLDSGVSILRYKPSKKGQ